MKVSIRKRQQKISCPKQRKQRHQKTLLPGFHTLARISFILCFQEFLCVYEFYKKYRIVNTKEPKVIL